MDSTRRTFLTRTIAVSAALAASRDLLAAQEQLSESDPSARALGYKANAATVDSKQFPKYQQGQRCSNCQFFRANAGDAFGACPMFGTRAVASNGWCNAYAKRT